MARYGDDSQLWATTGEYRVDTGSASKIEITATNTDITGTQITSKLPVAVFVFSLSDLSCGYPQSLFIEQIIPTYAWGYIYYILNTIPVATLNLRILTSEYNTTIKTISTYEDKVVERSDTIGSPREFIQMDLSPNVTFYSVLAKKPVLLLLYAVGEGEGSDGSIVQIARADVRSGRMALRYLPYIDYIASLFLDEACLPNMVGLGSNLVW